MNPRSWIQISSGISVYLCACAPSSECIIEVRRNDFFCISTSGISMLLDRVWQILSGWPVPVYGYKLAAVNLRRSLLLITTDFSARNNSFTVVLN